MANKLSRIWGIVARHLFSLSRDLERLAENFWWPTFDVMIWGLMTIFLQQKQGVSIIFINLNFSGVLNVAPR